MKQDPTCILVNSCPLWGLLWFSRHSPRRRGRDLGPFFFLVTCWHAVFSFVLSQTATVSSRRPSPNRRAIINTLFLLSSTDRLFLQDFRCPSAPSFPSGMAQSSLRSSYPSPLDFFHSHCSALSKKLHRPRFLIRRPTLAPYSFPPPAMGPLSFFSDGLLVLVNETSTKGLPPGIRYLGDCLSLYGCTRLQNVFFLLPPGECRISSFGLRALSPPLLTTPPDGQTPT